MMVRLLSFAFWLVIVQNKKVKTYKWSEFFLNQMQMGLKVKGATYFETLYYTL
jgi:hypothetical protein